MKRFIVSTTNVTAAAAWMLNKLEFMLMPIRFSLCVSRVMFGFSVEQSIPRIDRNLAKANWVNWIQINVCAIIANILKYAIYDIEFLSSR